MQRHFRLLVFLACVLAVAGALAQKQAITEKDIFQFNWVGDPQVSPDGSRVAFVRVTANEKKDGYDTSIWWVGMNGSEPPRRMTDGTRDSTPRWSPDDKWLLFVRTPENPASGGAAGGRSAGPQLYMLPLAGGESWKVTDLPRGTGSPVWSPDGKWIAFTSDTSAEDLAKQRKASAKAEQKEDKPASDAAVATPVPDHESDVRVITRSVYRANGGGYLDFKHVQHIWVVATPQSSEDAVTPKQLTTGKYHEENILWSKDGSQIYFTTTHMDDPSYELPRADVYSVPAAGGEVQKILALNLAPREISLSPDGRRLAFCAAVNEPVYSYTEPDLWVVDLAPGAKPRNLTEKYDFDMCSGVGGDQSAPRASGADHVVWTADGSGLIATTSREGKANLVRVDIATEKITEVTRGNQAVEHFRAAGDASKFVVAISTPTNVGDLFLIDHAGAEPRQLTHMNDKLFSQLNLTAPEEIWYTSFDGKRIHAWIQKPPDFDPSKKYPVRI